MVTLTNIALLEMRRVQCAAFVLQEREGLFQKFQDGQCDILVATDIASRGLDTCRVSNYRSNSCISCARQFLR